MEIRRVNDGYCCVTSTATISMTAQRFSLPRLVCRPALVEQKPMATGQNGRVWPSDGRFKAILCVFNIYYVGLRSVPAVLEPGEER